MAKYAENGLSSSATSPESNPVFREIWLPGIAGTPPPRATSGQGDLAVDPLWGVLLLAWGLLLVWCLEVSDRH
jgi:hypothetical protein